MCLCISLHQLLIHSQHYMLLGRVNCAGTVIRAWYGKDRLRRIVDLLNFGLHRLNSHVGVRPGDILRLFLIIAYKTESPSSISSLVLLIQTCWLADIRLLSICGSVIWVFVLFLFTFFRILFIIVFVACDARFLATDSWFLTRHSCIFSFHWTLLNWWYWMKRRSCFFYRCFHRWVVNTCNACCLKFSCCWLLWT